MTMTDGFELALSALIISSLWITLVLIIRRPVSRWIGARYAYYLWLVPLLSLIVAVLPFDPLIETNSFPEIGVPDIDWTVNSAASAITQNEGFRSAGTVMGSSVLLSNPIVVLMSLWFAGALVSLVLLISRSLRFSKALEITCQPLSSNQKEKLEQDCPDFASQFRSSLQVFLSARGPAITGLLHPVLLLPESFYSTYSATQRRLILQHEFQHLRRHDLFWLCLARLIKCLFWFNPLVHLAERYLQLDQELSCDELVLAKQSTATRRLYGETLLISLQREVAAPQVPYLPTFRQIKERTAMLKHHHSNTFSRIAGRSILAVFLLTSAAWGTSNAEQTAAVPLRESVWLVLQDMNERIAEIRTEPNDSDYEDYSALLQENLEFEASFDDGELSDYERAQIKNLSGYLSFLMNETEDAIAYYASVLPLSHESPELQSATAKTIVQLYFTIGEYEHALNYVDQLEALSGNMPIVNMFRAQSYFSLGNYEEALVYASQAISFAETNHLVPRESWFQLQKTAAFETGNVQLAAQSLEKLNQYYPNPDYQSELAEYQDELATHRGPANH